MTPTTQNTTITLPASRVKNRLGEVISEVQSGKYLAVIVENRGAPTVAIVNASEVPAMQERAEQEEAKQALARLRGLRAQVQSRLKKELSDEEALELTKDLTREVVDNLAKRKIVRFERDG